MSGPAEEESSEESWAPNGRVQSVDRALRLLDEVAAAPGGSTVSELAVTSGLNRATAWRLLGTLEAHGLVDRDPSSNRYRIGFSVLRLSAAAGHEGLRRRTHTVLTEVCASTGETAALAVPGPRGVTYVSEVAPTSVLSVNWLARDVPLHATSTGKAFLAWLPEPEAAALLQGALPSFTETTVTDRDLLLAELRTIRARGYAVCAGELEATLYGVSAPVLDPRGACVVAILSVWGPADRVPAARFPALGEVTMRGAGEVAALLSRAT